MTEAWQDSVIDERAELEGKITRLSIFVDDPRVLAARIESWQ